VVRLRLEPRASASQTLALTTPLLALALTVVLGVLLFLLLGIDPSSALRMFFVEPLRTAQGWSELSVKATPLILIALGLSVCYRSNVWNIGAEGQYIVGATFAGGAAMQAGEDTSRAYVLVVLLAGTLGGMLWAALVALLRDRFHASEILVSLMLVYVAELLLGYLVYGPWKDPEGYNFPQTIRFVEAARLPRMFSGYRIHYGTPLALLGVASVFVFVFRTLAGFRLQVVGLAPPAARYAGFSGRRSLWIALLLAGGLAGLAAALEIAGPLGQLTPYVPVGYGFTAIIVAFVGRLHPFGVVFSALLMSLFYIGGELAQSRLGLPKSLSSVFQGILLFALLACDTLIEHRVRFVRAASRPARGEALAEVIDSDGAAR
jgi:general nucleoside transport system permease protein